MDPQLSILLIENHADTLKYMTLYLEQMGHLIESATTVRDGIDRLENGHFDVLITDVGLNDGDGREVLQKARVCPQPYAIAMSGFGLTSDRSKSEESGFRHHLLKPFMPNELEELLAEALAEVLARRAQG